MSTVSVKRTIAASLRPLRSLVLYPGLPDSRVHYPADDLPTTAHFAAHAANATEPLGIVTLTRDAMLAHHAQRLSDEQPDAAWRIRGMATHPNARSQGIGAQLIDACIRHVRAHADEDPATSSVWCNAREVAFSFYLRNSFRFLTPAFDLPDIGPHRVMLRDVD